MADGTKIEWTDATWNPVTGCSVTSPGCTNCYAMKLAGTRMQHHHSRTGLTTASKAGPVWNGQVRLNEDWLTMPLQWKRPRRIFVCAHGDLFHENVPDQWIDKVFAVMALAPQHTFQVLTKRSGPMRDWLLRLEVAVRAWFERGDPSLLHEFEAMRGAIAHPAGPREWPLPNLWLGVSVEDQARALERIPDLLATPAAVRWLSCEPLLGPIDLTDVSDDGTGLDPECWGDCNCDGLYGFDPGCRRHGGDGSLTRKIDWVVAGGESGPGARPMHPAWVSDLRDQCAAAGTPFLFKQWGDWAPVCAIGEDTFDTLYSRPPATRPLASRRCLVDQLVMHDNGRIFPLDEWSRCSGEDPANGDFAFAAGSGAMSMMAIGKKKAGRELDGVTHDAFPAAAALGDG